MKGPPDTIQDEKPPEVVLEPVHQDSGRQNSNIMYDDAVDGLIVEPQSDNNIGAQALLENYSWMVNCEEFDKQVMEQIEQENYMEKCFEEMWREEASIGPVPSSEFHNVIRHNEQNIRNGIESSFDKLAVTDSNILVTQVCLNPNAVEFIPRSR